MSENLINTVTTKADFQQALKEVGIKATDACLVHTAMSKFNYVPGGPETIVQALEKTLSEGTLMMPSEVTTNCDPATWEYPPVRKGLIQIVRDNMPPYNPATSITVGLGVTPEYFRRLPDVVRSNHPYLPIAIWGKNKEKIAKKQPLNIPLGTDYKTCTMLHYSESTIGRKTETCLAATDVDENGKTIWAEYQNIDMDSYDDFNELGAAFEKAHPNKWKTIKLDKGVIKLIDAHALIDFAREWFKQKDNHQ